MSLDLRGKKVLLLGSGGLSIGQAGEFDYSGTQAIQALKELGAKVILVNPNIATVQTDPAYTDQVYLYPVEPEWVEKVIEAERPAAIVGGFGGQTALNCLIGLEDRGTLKRFGVQNLGTPVDVLRLTEDRELFAARMREIEMPIPPSHAASNWEDARRAASQIGYPVIIRAAYALGGLGSGFASDEGELQKLVSAALALSPQVLIEKSLKGWKELEYEVMRDGAGNSITICNMENFDPLGIHTGDSIVFCPSQTLSDDEYQMLRNASLKIVESLGVVGECNVQYALSPDRLEFYVIEVNARLSRSSALASKASGYPIAWVAAQVVSGKTLLEIRNPMTGNTCALFEPALDYVVVKIPRWDLGKFSGVSRKLGSAMKSVGEVMAIGRSIAEALQKGVRMVTENGLGLSVTSVLSDAQLEAELAQPTDARMFAAIEFLRRGGELEHAKRLSGVDLWFLRRLQEIVETEAEIRRTAVLQKIDMPTWQRWKRMGFSDDQVAFLREPALGTKPRELEQASLGVRKAREAAGVRPVAKKIDTTAAEYDTPSNYLYLTYWGDRSEASKPTTQGALVLGSGTYRIGTSVEFDWCAVSASRALQKHGWRSVILNCNPETVSTDYNRSDRLYFEEMTLERIRDIAEIEGIAGVIASMGGQLPNRLAAGIERAGLKLLGHGADAVDRAENRGRFSQILDSVGIGQPQWTEARTAAEVSAFVGRVGFPVLVRPSYVLSGAAMNVATTPDSLDHFLSLAQSVSPDHPVVLSKFHQGMRELEVDGVASSGKLVAAVVSEHIEDAGVHSGDATIRCPATGVPDRIQERVLAAAHEISKALDLNGPANFQFLANDREILVIECNARASRSFPFVSKVVGVNLAELATEAAIGAKVRGWGSLKPLKWIWG